MLKVGFIGIDNITDLRCRMLTREAEVKLCCCFHADQPEADRLAGCHRMESLQSPERVIEECDVVFIADIDSETKSAAIQQAIDKGKAVVCEPPLLMEESAAKRAEQSIDRNRASCTVSFYSRFQVPIRSFRDIVRSGRLGEPKNYWVQISDFFTQPTGKSEAFQKSSLLLQLLIEEVDLMRWIGGEVADWKAHYGEQETPGGGRALALAGLFTLEGGKTASLMLCSSSKWRQATRGFICSEGSLKMGGSDRWRCEEMSFAVCDNPDTQVIHFEEAYNLDLAVREHDHALIRRLLAEGSPLVSLREGLRACEVASKLIQMNSSGR